MDTVVIYPGRFHPFHKGHKSVYDALVKRFGKNRVYIATSNKVDPPKSPFTFDEKRAMMALTGVDPSRVVQVKNPYQATEITDNFDPQNTIALFAVSDKDMAEDPRFSFKPRKDGQPSYYQPASKDMQGFDKHGYIITVPTLQFNVLGKPMRSASEFRANFARADSETQRAMITDLFGQYDPKTHNTMAQKIVEQLIRADEILDKLIEMGADDCYILEACIRVEALVESINMKQRKQTLYQAIMEGGHSLPENIVSTPANQFGAMRKTDTLADKTVMSKSAQTYTKQAQRKQAAQDARQGAQQSTIVKTPNQPKINFGEEITDFNTEDPMNSVIAIRGIGTMSISSALEKVSEMAMDIAKLGAMKDAKNVQDNLPRYMDLLATYNESIQEAYRELAQQRKRGGTASRGIDKDISESDNLSTDNVDPRFKNLIKTAIIKYPFAKNAMDAVLHMMSDKLKTDAAQSADIKRLDKENDAQDTEIDDLEKQIAKEHCGDPMAHEHKPGRMLLMKLYKKEMQCQPGSPEHFEVMKMIDGCRKNIGLEEGMWDTVTKTVGKAAQAVGKTVQGAVDNRTATLTGGKKKSASSFRPS
jgi:cytidyltransferase-like protein